MRRPVGALVVAVLAGYIAVAAAGVRDDRRLIASAPVPTDRQTAVIEPDAQLCAPPVAVPFATNAVQLTAVTGGAPGPPLVVTVRAAAAARPLSVGRLPGGYRVAGYPDRPVQTVELRPAVAVGRRVSVCVTNAGRTSVALYAGRGQKARRDHGISIVALRPQPRSAVALLPTIFERAALFKASWVRPWVLWLIAMAAVVGLPALLAWALSAALREAGTTPERRPVQARDDAESPAAAVVPGEEALGVERLTGAEPIGPHQEVAQNPDGDAAEDG